MGRYYALHDGENPRVADAIAEHYKPLGPNDTCPTSPESVAVALADKIDTLVAFFSIGERPTGSRDPFALRRAALGIIRLVLENRLPLSLIESFEEAALCLAAERIADLLSNEVPRAALPPNLTQDVLQFIADRLKVHLRDEGFRHDQISAVFARFGEGVEDDLVRIRDCLSALRSFLASDDGINLLVAYRRASNIVSIEERRDDRTYDDPVDTSAFEQPEEARLYERLNGMSTTLETFYSGNRFDQAMSRLATLRQPIDEFFDRVTVNVDDQKLRRNRLRLLSQISRTMNYIADFSQIEG
jgi:glycyl-tRNA synthetase beta chain